MANSKSTKRALVSSALAVLMCVTMLIGTTFAWFTDTATSGRNTIQSGNLNMEVYHDGDVKIDGKTDLFNSVDGQSIIWEPGAAAEETFVIKNEGNLALKYKFTLSFTDATTVNGKSLADILTVKVGDADAVKLADFVKEDNLLGGASDTLTVKIAWTPSDNDNDFNVAGGLKIDLGINVVATQYTYEKDGYGNTYDSGALLPDETLVAEGVVYDETAKEYKISTAAGLKYVADTFNTSDATRDKIFVLTNDIDMTGISWTPWCNEGQYFCGAFDGCGYTIKNLTINDTTNVNGHATGFIGRLGANGLGEKTIKNVTFDHATVTGYHWVGTAVGYNEFGTVEKVTVTNSVITATCIAETADDAACGDKAGALIGFCGPNSSAIVKDCTVSASTVTAARDAAKVVGFGYAVNTFENLSADNVTVTANAGACPHSRAGEVSANALVGNGTEAGLN